uniref:Uncharacterized protein n=1 Tax=Zea mays TaxID=4577 RepID=C0PNG3_MAIZE|nr:unknown [Zea mays]
MLSAMGRMAGSVVKICLMVTGFVMMWTWLMLQINDQRFEDAEEEQESHENNGH